MSNESISIVLPSKNEARNLEILLPKLASLGGINEIVVVDDSSSDNTEQICKKYDNIRIIKHLYSKGNGAAIKTGTSSVDSEVIIFMDADGQHKPEYISKLIEKYRQGYAMVVGARDTASQSSLGRLVANSVYNKLASWMVGQNIEDLTSGFRIVNAKKFKEFLHLLPNGFSYPTTSTMAFFRAGYSVGYIPIENDKRLGRSHIDIVKDGARFLLIIFKIGTLYSPLKLFVPISVSFWTLGAGYYLYTLFTEGRFTNMSALLFSTSVITFLIGLVSEQITTLLYSRNS